MPRVFWVVGAGVVAFAFVLAGVANAVFGQPGRNADEQHQLSARLCREEGALGVLTAVQATNSELATPVFFRAADATPDSLAVGLRALYAQVGLMDSAEREPILRESARGLDLRVQAPLAMLVAALVEAGHLHEQGRAPRAESLRMPAIHPTMSGSRSDTRSLAYDVAASEILLTTVDLARPMIAAAVAQGVWPTQGNVIDSLGLIHIGGTGNDMTTENFIFSIDPDGNDVYGGRVGGSGTGVGIFPPDVQYPVGFAWDLLGNDKYVSSAPYSLGAGADGVGILLDDSGDDYYADGSSVVLGSAVDGVGLFVDSAGDDAYVLESDGGGAVYGAHASVGLFMELAGNDTYRTYVDSFGVISIGDTVEKSGALAFFCDREGTDSYDSERGRSFGFGADSYAAAWFVDLGGDEDSYHSRYPVAPFLATNDAAWIAGFSGGQGHGFDGV